MKLSEQEKAVIAIIERARNEIAKLGFKPTAKHGVSRVESLEGESAIRVFEAGLTVGFTACSKLELESAGNA